MKPRRAGSTPGYDDRFVEDMAYANGVELFYRRGGPRGGPFALLIHGHTQASDMWGPMAVALADSGYDVVAPDLRGLGRSSITADGYEKANLALDLQSLLDVAKPGFRPGVVIGHDLGAMVAYAFAAQFSTLVDRLVLMEATQPGLGIWRELLANVRVCWHFGFFGPYAEALLAGREDIYLERFWNEFAGDPDVQAVVDSHRRVYIDSYRRTNGVRGALAHFEAFVRDEADNARFSETRLRMPCLGVGGEKSLGGAIGEHAFLLSERPHTAIIDGSGHWLIDERPEATVNVVREFVIAG